MSKQQKRALPTTAAHKMLVVEKGIRMYNDAQQGSRQVVLTPESVDSVKGNIVYEAWTRTRTGEELWVIFVDAKCGNDEVTFAYPINTEAGISVETVIRFAERQHREYGRPPIVGRPEIVRVTQDFINRLRGKADRRQEGTLVCDFCSAETQIVTRFEALDFVLQTGTLSVGAWGACPTCSELVVSRDLEGLVERMVKTSGIRSRPAWEFARRQVQDFFLHKLEQTFYRQAHSASWRDATHAMHSSADLKFVQPDSGARRGW